MKNRLEVQNIQGDELFMELTPEELQELEQVKGGVSLPKPNDSLSNQISPLYISKIKDLRTTPLDRPFPYGVPAIFKSNELDISKNISKQGLKS